MSEVLQAMQVCRSCCRCISCLPAGSKGISSAAERKWAWFTAALTACLKFPLPDVPTKKSLSLLPASTTVCRQQAHARSCGDFYFCETHLLAVYKAPKWTMTCSKMVSCKCPVIASQPSSKCVHAWQEMEARLLGSLDQTLAEIAVRREGSNDESRLSAAAPVPSTMLAGDGFMTFDPSMPSTQSTQQQQQGEEEEDGRQAAYERMQVSF